MEIEVSTRKNEALSEYGFFIPISDFVGHLTFLVLVPSKVANQSETW